MWAISLMIMPACFYTFGMVYLVLSIRCIHQTPHLAHVILLSVISSSHNSVRLSPFTIYHYYQYSVQHVINWSMLSVSSEFSYHVILLHLLLCFFSYVQLHLLYIVHAQYLSSIDAYVRYIFS